MMCSIAPVVKWISLLSSEQSLWVRILPGAQARSFVFPSHKRVWFSGRMTAFQAVDGSSILPTRTNNQKVRYHLTF